jgi:hypothetical protein
MPELPLLIALTAFFGCAAPTTDSAPDDASNTDLLDDDNDGITNGDEATLGTDPNDPDTDGDGYTDLEEVEGHTDPTDITDHPYTGGWSIAACRDTVQGTGNEEGDIALDFTLTDQFGDNVRLHSFCDRAVLLVGAAFW